MPYEMLNAAEEAAERLVEAYRILKRMPGQSANAQLIRDAARDVIKTRNYLRERAAAEERAMEMRMVG